MKRASLIAVGIMMLLSCENGSISKRLTEVDSLVIKEEYDSAYQMVKDIDEQSITRAEDKAHYHLISVQTGYLVQKPLASADSLLDEVIAYYQKKNNAEKLADAYYYKAISQYLTPDIPKSILYYKNAERFAAQSGNLYQQHKIAEGICFVNRQCANYYLELEYAKKALNLAKRLDDKKRMVYAYYELNLAYLFLGYEDSSQIVLSRIPPLINHVDKEVLPHLLSNLGYMFLSYNPTEAKKYFLKALSYKELTGAYEHLAEIVYEEGKPEQAYQYWKKALSVPDQSPKDNIIRNLIEYDLERGKTDSISEMVTQIFEIRDSIDAKLRNDTIKDLQTQFDHEIALKEKDQMITRGILLAVIVLFLLIAFHFWRRHLAKVKLLGYRMQIHDCLSQIEILKASGKDSKQEIDKLNGQIKDIMDNKSRRLIRGRMLYDDIMANKTIVDWKQKDEEVFLDYFVATNYSTVQRLKKVPRNGKLTVHRLFYVILVELGKTDEDIRRILSISDATLRTLRFRTKPLE